MASRERAICAVVWLARWITTSVKDFAQRSAIHSAVGSDHDYPGPWFPAIPFVPHFDIHSLADNLDDDPSARFFGA
jgi:hypothetical protein